MIRLNSKGGPFRYLVLPVEEALMATRLSQPWRSLQRRRPQQKNRRSGLLGSGTRKGQALLKKLERADGSTKSIQNRL